MTVDRDVRMRVFQKIVADGAMPAATALAEDLSLPESDVRESLRRLHDGRALVLEPGRDDIIRMANPFSGIETPFAVEANGKRYYGNCIWDSLGIPALLGTDAEIRCSCGDCGEQMRVSVYGGTVHGEGIIQIGVPARHWWDDIIFT